VYNAIACFVISALALATFCACFFGGAILKKKAIILTKKKQKLIYLFIYLLMQHARLNGVAINFI
jgi:hypothetical protein